MAECGKKKPNPKRSKYMDNTKLLFELDFEHDGMSSVKRTGRSCDSFDTIKELDRFMFQGIEGYKE
jgi:hypothetical protein